MNYSIEYFLQLLEEYGIKFAKNGFIALPKEHCFATWRIASRRAMGADGYAMYWNAVYEVRLFYRENKTESDEAIERKLESRLRELDGLESNYDYNPDDKLDITLYRFNGAINFKEE